MRGYIYIVRPDDVEKHIKEILRLIGEIEGFLQGVSFSDLNIRDRSTTQFCTPYC